MTTGKENQDESATPLKDAAWDVFVEAAKVNGHVSTDALVFRTSEFKLSLNVIEEQLSVRYGDDQDVLSINLLQEDKANYAYFPKARVLRALQKMRLEFATLPSSKSASVSDKEVPYVITTGEPSPWGNDHPLYGDARYVPSLVWAVWHLYQIRKSELAKDIDPKAFTMEYALGKCQFLIRSIEEGREVVLPPDLKHEIDLPPVAFPNGHPTFAKVYQWKENCETWSMARAAAKQMG